ncbi:MAG: right-handed parallel beta-helix repeat-containing protein [Anaerolineaceae bacterium]|nr:right-handed parallel beta-helix repeat-containing protein [Anaerolineaceae bacterium]MCB9098356.1 right-handed parallel beta-helix repeat-containing protein [Anaerolineales bacterium]
MQWIDRITSLAFSVSILLIITLQTTSAQMGLFYVDANTGSDITGDGSAGKPWQSIRYAANQIDPGDTVLINPGSYDGGITVDTAGTQTAPITFKSTGSGVIIEGSGGERDAFFITEADYVIVDGLTIQHADRAGLRISLSDHVTIRNCTFIDNVRWGIFTDFSDYTLVENSESSGAAIEHGIYISNSSDYPTIRNNRLHHNHANGLHMNGDISQGGDGIISGALVEGNVIYENGTGGGSGINMDGVTDSTVRNNLLYDNHASGISIYQIDGGSGSQNNRILNNTIIMPSDARWAINIPDTVDTGNQIFNNILLNQHSWKGSILIAEPDQASFESDYNIVVNRFNTHGNDADNTNGLSLTGWQALGYDTHSIIATADDVFVDAAAHDYRLKEGGPAIDAGTTLPDVPTDLDGHNRPAGLGFDIGAYEYGSTGTTPLGPVVYLPIILAGL